MASYFGFRTGSTPSAPATAQNDTSRATGTSAGSSSPSLGSTAPTPVNLGELLLSNNQDPLTALANLVTSYNTLLTTQSTTSSQSVQSERDKLAAENAKLWGWCTNSTKEKDKVVKELRETRVRIAELEGLLRTNNVAVPPPRSLSTSPSDELNVPSRPRPSRSFSDDPPRSGTPSSDSSRRIPRSPNGGTAMAVSRSEQALAQPKATSPVSFPHQEAIEAAVESPNPLVTPTTAKPSQFEGLARKASSLDLGRKEPIETGSRSRTPPPGTPSSGARQDPQSNGEGHSLPSMPPLSPLWPPQTPTRSDSARKEGLGINSSPPQAAGLSQETRHRGQSDIPGSSHITSGSGSSLAGNGKQRESPNMSSSGELEGQNGPQVEHRPSFSHLRGHTREKRPPTLTPSMLSHLSVRVLTSSIRLDPRGKEIVSFSIQVCLQVPPEHDPHKVGGQVRWVVEKSQADILQLDGDVRGKNNKSQTKKIAPVPDKSLFKDHAPSRVDQRKVVLQGFLQSLLSTPLQDRADVCHFFNSNVISERNVPISNPAHKAGHLTKKGRSFGGWQTRYYVLNGPGLDYYENQGGPHLGTINLSGAQIGRQQNNETSTPDSYRHAFLIREKAKDAKNSKQEDHDHILCAESDSERDEWVRVLAAWSTGEYVEPAEVMPIKQQPLDRTPLRSFDSERPSTDSRRLAHKESREDGQRTHPGGSGVSRGGDIPASSSYGQHGRQQSFGQVSTASMAENEHHRQGAHHQLQGTAHRAAHLHDMSASLSAPSALSELASARQVQVPPTLVERPATATDSHTDSHLHHRSPSHGSSHLMPEEVKRQPHSSNERPMSPDRKRSDGDQSQSSKKSISGPRNAVPIGDGHTFKHMPAARKEDDRRARVKSSFWGFAKSDRREQPGPLPVARPVFGIPLADAVAIARVRDDFELPAVVYRCIEYLEAKSAPMEEGIYRLSGSNNTIKQLKERFDHEGDVNLLGCGDYLDVHAVAGLLKLYLRELPVHVLTRELQPHFFSVTEEPDRTSQVNKLGLLIGQLPTPNYTLLRFLTAHLIHVVQSESVNKMSLRNVGIVFNPTLRLPAQLFSLLLTEFDLVFAMDGDQPCPRELDGEAAADSPTVSEPRPRRRSRNSMIYEASGADHLLESGARLQVPVEEEEGDTADKTVEHFGDGLDEATVDANDEVHGSASHEAREHPYQERGKDLGLQIHTYAAPNGLGLPASPRSPLHSGQTSPSMSRLPGSPLSASPRHTQRV